MSSAIPSAVSAAATAVANIQTNPAVNAATRASLELVVSSAVGIAAIDRGLLTSATIKALSQTTFTILLPLFLGTSIIKTITNYGLTKSSLAVPVLAATQSFLLYLCTTRIVYPLLLQADQRDTDDARGTAVCASFGNAGVVPLIFCDSLFRASNDDNLALSTGFVSMFLVGWSPFFWSFGRSVLLGGDINGDGSGSGSKKSSTTTRKEQIISFIKPLLPPPVMGVLMGIVVATMPLLRTLFVGSGSGSATSTSSAVTATAKPALFGVVYDTAQNFGKAASPLSLLVLVSSLALGAGFGKQHQQQQPQQSTPPKKDTARRKSKNSIDIVDVDDNQTTTISFLKRWAIVSFMRFIISPALMFGLLRIASSNMLGRSLIGTSVEQPMLWFVCILESCMPPAQNQVVMLQVANKMTKANEMATFLFSVYATSMVPLTIVISVALDKFGLMK